MRVVRQNLHLLSKSGRYLAELIFIHLLSSLSLYYFSQYFFMFFLQIVFLVLILPYKKSFIEKLMYFSYLVCLNYVLVLIFSFTAYTLYFINLSAIIFFIYNHVVRFSIHELFTYGVFAALAVLLLRYFEDDIFDIYIYLDIADEQNYVSMESAVLLSAMHFFILFFLMFKKDRKNLGYNKEND